MRLSDQTAVTNPVDRRAPRDHVTNRRNATNVANINVVTVTVAIEELTLIAPRPMTSPTQAPRIFKQADHTPETKDKTQI